MTRADNQPEDPTGQSPATTGLDGVIVIDKPIGMSSMGAVARVRRRAGRRGTGHAGTLDPLATGVLVMGVGRATRILERLMKTTKRYVTTVDLSAFTATDDREGEREEVRPVRLPTRAEVAAMLVTFVGTIDQRPPAFSAIKVGGRRAYKLARRGAEVELPTRRILVHDLHLDSYDWPMAVISIHCDKGFYVRSLARDLGVGLGTGGHCATLRRTAVGPFTEAMAASLDDLPDPLKQTDLLSIDEALSMVDLEEEGEDSTRRGSR